MVGMEGLLQAKQVAKAELEAAIKSNAHLEIIRALTQLFDDAAAELREAQAPPPPQAPRPASASVVNFWRSLGSATLVDGFLVLHGGTFFLGAKNKPDRIMVRKCYEDFLEIIQEQMYKGVTKIVITGSPGIGKSYFLYYLLHHLKSLPDKPVVVLSGPGKTMPSLCFHGDNVYDGEFPAFTEYLKDPNTWYLVDGHVPHFCNAKTVLAASPNQKLYRAFLKLEGATRRTMPEWTKEELDTCRLRMYGTLDQATMDDRYNKWGGRPRFVLEKAEDKSQQAQLDEAIDKSTLLPTLRSLGESTSSSEASDCLLTIQVGPDYIETYVTFASVYIQERVLSKLSKVNRDDIDMWLDSTEGRPTFGTIRGLVFERITHNDICSGNFEVICKDLETGALVKDPFPLPVKRMAFKDYSELSTAADQVYCTPASPTLGAVDALMKPCHLFQLTVRQEHPVKVEPLNEAVKALGAKEANLYFVVHASVFDNFTTQSYEQSKKNKQQASTQQAQQPAMPAEASSPGAGEGTQSTRSPLAGKKPVGRPPTVVKPASPVKQFAVKLVRRFPLTPPTARGAVAIRARACMHVRTSFV
eukprot:CAMPEP_0202890160 /NCGR_PEP_ID=MMETSP1392-20130828/660_1 /ASSEMBLY_ACC=CAM_ASM_000868 /TAXON_ID=225041 /ORGANISM="Chlamydomonas chlamydogama, Strain SAG 11-48b" /LENGTH=584 /DNA_ID=CAMNT_0049573679 /DNA_START=72 /DNA_END=1826 /DNA_ORIENTATION=+